jgi:hypothetical protein
VKKIFLEILKNDLSKQLKKEDIWEGKISQKVLIADLSKTVSHALVIEGGFQNLWKLNTGINWIVKF